VLRIVTLDFDRPLMMDIGTKRSWP
jgi:hypothetical protein